MVASKLCSKLVVSKYVAVKITHKSNWKSTNSYYPKEENNQSKKYDVEKI